MSINYFVFFYKCMSINKLNLSFVLCAKNVVHIGNEALNANIKLKKKIFDNLVWR